MRLSTSRLFQGRCRTRLLGVIQYCEYMNKDIIKFGLVGAVNTAIDFLLLNLFVSLGLSIFWAIFFAYLIGAANGYLLNNHWTYRHLNKPTTFFGFIQYTAISFIGLGLTELIVYGLFHIFHLSINIDKLVAVVVVFLVVVVCAVVLCIVPLPVCAVVAAFVVLVVVVLSVILPLHLWSPLHLLASWSCVAASAARRR